MAFDLSRAVPVNKSENNASGKFDLSRAVPVSNEKKSFATSMASDIKSALLSNPTIKGPVELVAGPIIGKLDNVAQAVYSNAKKQLMESPAVTDFNSRFSDKPVGDKLSDSIRVLSPIDLGAKIATKALSGLSQRDVAKGIENLGIDTAVFSIAGSGVNAAALGRDFIKNKAFASNANLMDDLFSLNHKILKETSKVMQKKSSNEAVREVAKIITKSNNPIEVRLKLDGTVKRIFDERNSIIAEHNTLIEPSHIKALEDYLGSNNAVVEMTDTQRASANSLLNQAKEELKSIGANFDKLTAQRLKEKYQDLAQYEKSPDANIRGTAIAARKIATSLKDLILKDLPKNIAKKVEDTNKRYSGLKEAVDIFSTLEERFKTDPSKFQSGLKSYFTQIAGRSGVGQMVGAAIRFSPKIVGHGSFKSSTASIESLKNEYMATRAILENRLKQAPMSQRVVMSDIIDKKMLSNKLFDSSLLPAPEPSGLGRRAIRISENLKGEVINLPETTETKLSELAKKFSVPEYSSKRSVTKSFGDLEGEAKVKQALKSRKFIKESQER